MKQFSSFYNNPKIIIGKSAVTENICSFIQRAALSNLPVLLVGETGVGKEVVAREIHRGSQRREGPFIPINSSCIPENLIESELYGYRRFAFTDAKEDKIGLIEEAKGGTFFFDEISEISLHIQAKFLRVVEHKEIRRLGENRKREIDVRFIFATNKDLIEEVEAGRFREDLYYRICILELYIPPLRERKEDIPLLVEHILKEENKENNGNKRISKEALARLIRYRYPGNIRELENIIKRAYVFSDYSKDLSLKKVYDFFITNELVKMNDVILSFVNESDTNYYTLFPYNKARFIDEYRMIFDAICEKIGQKINLCPIESDFISTFSALLDDLNVKRFSNLFGTCLFDIRLFLDVKGIFHVCEKINHLFPLGNVWDGLNFGKMSQIAMNYINVLNKKCKNCEVKYLCHRCYAAFAKKGKFEIDDEFCNKKTKRSIINSLEYLIQLKEKEVIV